VEAETRGVSEDQDYLRNDPFVYVPVSVPEERSYTKDGRLKMKKTPILYDYWRNVKYVRRLGRRYIFRWR
jgi:hypothetical protein